ncbi:hypothetical protein C0J52_19073 [Blattella germanica]|nr:hypothetical protein C0J52_19073 [Blattella germanica]
MEEIWIVTIATVLSLVGPSTQCIDDCQCTPFNVIDCSDKNFTVIPSSVNIAQTDIFNFSLNSIETLQRNEFLTKNLIHIQAIDLSYNLISSIHIDAFKGLGDLTVLYLTGNKLMMIHAEVFHPLRNLTFLDLSRNNITNIDLKAFEGLGNLRELDLYDNILEKFHKEIFKPLKSLKEIRLQFMRGKLAFDDATEEEIKNCLCERSRALLWSKSNNIEINATCEYSYEESHTDPVKDCKFSIFPFIGTSPVSKTLITNGDLIIAIIITVGVLLLLVVALTILAVVVSHSEDKVEDDGSEMGDFEPYRGHISPLKDAEFFWPHVKSSKYVKETTTSRLQLCSNDMLEEVKTSSQGLK